MNKENDNEEIVNHSMEFFIMIFNSIKYFNSVFYTFFMLFCSFWFLLCKRPPYSATQNALENLSLDIDSGENLFVIGGSGSGKSVLVKSIVGILPRSSGVVKMNSNQLFEARLTRVFAI